MWALRDPWPSLAALAVATGIWMSVDSAHAQLPDPPLGASDADFAIARDAFVEGIEHAAEERHRQAQEAFERSYRLSGSSAALFNLARTLVHLERYRDADEASRRLLALPELDAETRARAHEVQREANASMARLTLRGVPHGRADVLIDGQVCAREERRPLEVTLDPGLRVVRIELAGRPSFTWTGTLAAGQQVDAPAQYSAQSTAQSTAPAPLEVPRPPPVEEGPHWPAIVGVALGALALAVGGIVVGLVLSSPSLEPRTDLVIRLP